MAKVNEGSTSYHDFTLLGVDGGGVVPEALRYRLTAGNGVELIPWTQLALDCRQIEISAELNTIGDSGPWRYLAIEATHSGGDKITEEKVYKINELKGVP